MTTPRRPHVLGIDDGPFEKRSSQTTALVGVMMEGPDLVEAVAVGELRVDAADVTETLAGWIGQLRCRPALQAVMLGGITIAGLSIVDLRELARRLARPVLAVTRHPPENGPLRQALHAAGLTERIPLLEAAPRAQPLENGLHLAWAGTDAAGASALVAACLGKSLLPEPLRLAHLIARAVASGESRGRP